MWLGNFNLGDEITLPIYTTDASNMPADPTLAHGVAVRGSSGNVVFQDRAWQVDANVTGLFQYRLQLGSDFSEGWYIARYSYDIGGSPFLDVDVFYVNGLGAEDGNVISLYHWELPHGQFVARHQADNDLVFGFNPRVE